jgi:hypothetical protein
VTIEDLLERLNAQVHLPANKNITARTLEDWVYEDLIPGPTRAGGTREPNWQWSEESFDAAFRVVEYRERGFKRYTAIRSQQWLERQSPLSIETVREDLIMEFACARNLLLRYVSSTHGLRADSTLSEYKRRALLRQIGPLDPIFERAGINPGGAVFILFYELARFGEQISGFHENEEPLAALLAKAVLPNGVHIFAGLLETDETHPPSAVRAMRRLTSEQFDQCRASVALFPVVLSVMQLVAASLSADEDKKGLLDTAYLAALSSFDRWPWSISSFGLVANILYNSELKIDSDHG